MSILKFFKNLFSSKKQVEVPMTIDLDLKNKDVFPPLENKPTQVIEVPVTEAVVLEATETPVAHQEVTEAPKTEAVVPQITDAVTVENPTTEVVEPKKTAKEIKAKAKKEVPVTEDKPNSKPKPKNK